MEKIFTERAHLMCPNMNFGIIMSLKAEYDEQSIIKSVNLLAEAHPFLKSLLGFDGNTYFYDVTKDSQIRVVCKNEYAAHISDQKVFDDYDELTKSEWDITKEGMLKVVAYRMKGKTLFLLAFHHLIADGRGAFMLANELAACYVSGIKPDFVQEKLISPKEDMPKGSKLSFTSRLFIKYANRQWKKEKHRVTYSEYLKLAADFTERNKIKRRVQIIPADEYKSFTAKCNEKKVSVNDYLVSKMILEENVEKIIVACDLRNELKCYNPGALGNYSTAFSVERRNKNTDIWELSERIHKTVNKKKTNLKYLYLILQCYAELKGELLDASFVSSERV